MEAVYITVRTWMEAIHVPALRDLLWVSMVENVMVSQLSQGLITIINFLSQVVSIVFRY